MNYYFKSILTLTTILCFALVDCKETLSAEDVENNHEWDYKLNGADWPSKFK